MNIGIILAAGNSTRFNDETPKQLYLIDDKPVELNLQQLQRPFKTRQARLVRMPMPAVKCAIVGERDS